MHELNILTHWRVITNLFMNENQNINLNLKNCITLGYLKNDNYTEF